LAVAVVPLKPFLWPPRSERQPLCPSLLVDVVHDGQQVVAHGLEGELVEDWGHRVEGPVQDDELGAGLIGPLNTPPGSTGRQARRQTERQTHRRSDTGRQTDSFLHDIFQNNPSYFSKSLTSFK